MRNSKEIRNLGLGPVLNDAIGVWVPGRADSLRTGCAGEVVGGLISLRTIMERYNARSWFVLTRYLSVVESLSLSGGAPDERDLELLKHIRSECETLGFAFSVLQLDRMIDSFQAPPTRAEFSRMVGEFNRRVIDEASSTLFFQVPARDAQLYEANFLFGDMVAVRFPSLSWEIAEAGKCLALERNTACVFHLMRVVEGGCEFLSPLCVFV